MSKITIPHFFGSKYGNIKSHSDGKQEAVPHFVIKICSCNMFSTYLNKSCKLCIIDCTYIAGMLNIEQRVTMMIRVVYLHMLDNCSSLVCSDCRSGLQTLVHNHTVLSARYTRFEMIHKHRTYSLNSKTVAYITTKWLHIYIIPSKTFLPRLSFAPTYLSSSLSVVLNVYLVSMCTSELYKNGIIKLQLAISKNFLTCKTILKIKSGEN